MIATKASMTTVLGPNSLVLAWHPQLAEPHELFFLFELEEMVETSLIELAKRATRSVAWTRFSEREAHEGHETLDSGA